MLRPNKRPRLTEKVQRGFRHWLPVMEAILKAPASSDLRELNDIQIEEAHEALTWLVVLLSKVKDGEVQP